MLTPEAATKLSEPELLALLEQIQTQIRDHLAQRNPAGSSNAPMPDDVSGRLSKACELLDGALALIETLPRSVQLVLAGTRIREAQLWLNQEGNRTFRHCQSPSNNDVVD